MPVAEVELSPSKVKSSTEIPEHTAGVPGQTVLDPNWSIGPENELELA
jgi:hypothetical protein